MLDQRTREYLRQLQNTLEGAEEICQCGNCTKEREKKQITQCDKDRILQYLPSKIVRPYASNFVPEISPSYELWHSAKRRPF
jgi:hypothetical protein